MRIVERYGPGFKLLRGVGGWALFVPWRFVLSLLYGCALKAPFLSPRGAARQRPVGRPDGAGAEPRVTSIGNVEAGGGGKTPCALRLAEEIRARGGTPVVVSRGYRGIAQRYAPCVVPAGRKVGAVRDVRYTTEAEALLRAGASSSITEASMAALLGDEIMLYRRRGIPVVIDADRGRGGRLATRLFSATHILLDDAFQNRSIAKDVDIVLLDADKPFGNGRLLPLGPLREPPSAIGRADIVIFTRAESDRLPPEAERLVEGKRVYFASHDPVDLIDAAGAAKPLTLLAGLDCILFSGIARPDSFEMSVNRLGARPRMAFRFVDHHRYTERDILGMFKAAGGEIPFITTEKDWVKTHDFFPPRTELFALRVTMSIREIETLIDCIG